jgi:hypothetical protein
MILGYLFGRRDGRRIANARIRQWNAANAEVARRTGHCPWCGQRLPRR